MSLSVAKIIAFLSVLVIVGSGLSAFYIIKTNPKIDFLNPFASQFKPDLKTKVTAKFLVSPKMEGDVTQHHSLVPANIRYLVYNLDTHHIYYSKGIIDPIPAGSFTKLLTSMVALDLVSPDTMLTATLTSIDKEPTILGLKEGEQLSLSELIRASISTSANDAAATIAQGISAQFGLQLKDYLELMNLKAKTIGMTDSHFVNPEGYDDPDQKTTILDLVKLVDSALSYPSIASAGGADRQDIVKTSTHGFYYLPNWNGLLGVYPGVSGLKIARTQNMGYATIVISQRKDKRIAVILLGAKTLLERDTIAAALLDLGFKQEKIQPIDLSAATLKKKYKIWDDLAIKIKTELGLLPKP